MIAATEGLYVAYQNRNYVLKDIELVIPRGTAYGLLGLNGAGKTTLIRTLLGLLKPKAGSVQVFGYPLENRAMEIHRRIGALIEEPSLYKHLTARENLEITAVYRGLPTKRIAQVLELVGLANTGRKKVKRFSTGMKQRLGLAIALLSDPEFVILDEPTSGLDPQGIAEMRQLLSRMQTEMGKTVLLSSHILSEVEKTCTHVGIIRNGALVFQGKINDLPNTGGQYSVRIETSANERIAGLWNAQYRPEVSANAERLLLPVKERQEISHFIDFVRKQKEDIWQIVPETTQKLEELFLRITQNNP